MEGSFRLRSVRATPTLEGPDHGHRDHAAAHRGDNAAPAPPSSGSPVAAVAAPRPTGLDYVCSACFGPLEVALRPRGRRRDASPARSSRRGPPASGATASCSPSTRPGAQPRRRRHAARRRGPPGRGARRRPPARQGRHPQPDALVQGPRRRDRRGQGRSSSASRRWPARAPATSPARRPPRPPPPACPPTSSCPRTSSPRRSSTPSPTARRSCPSTAPTTTSTGSASRSPTSSAGASSTSTSARTTPRAARRSPTRSPSRSAGGCRTSSSRPIASGSMLTRVARALRRARRARLVEPKAVRFVGGQAAGCAPGRDGVRDRRRHSSPGPHAGHDRPLARDRQPGRRRATRSSSRGGRGGSIEAIDDATTAEAIRRAARLEGIYTETAGGVTLARGRGGPPARGDPRRRRGRRAAHRQRPQDPGRASASASTTPSASRRPGRPGLAPVLPARFSAFEGWLSA